MATIDSTIICNMALTQLGATRILSLTENSKNARECNAIYEYIRNAVLKAFPWSFAQKRVALTETGSDPVWTDDLMTVAYTKPTDLLKVNFTNVENALVKVEGNEILSDTSELKIKYTYENTTPSTYTSEFMDALAARLAAELAIPITNKASLAESLFAIYYEKKLPQAISVDSQQGTPNPPAQDEWLNARRQGAGELVGQTSWETWYPPCWC